MKVTLEKHEINYASNYDNYSIIGDNGLWDAKVEHDLITKEMYFVPPTDVNTSYTIKELEAIVVAMKELTEEIEKGLDSPQ